jgi:hypothetical protein
MMGNLRLKAGTVTEKDSNMIMAEVVTTDKGDLVQRFNVDRRTGFWQPVPWPAMWWLGSSQGMGQWMERG